jgi:TolB-like protein/Flp pilus assembly protein TadD
MRVSSTSSSASQYRFADFVLDVRQRRLRRGEQVIVLGRLTFALLRVLVEEAPNCVSHQVLTDRVWGPRRVVTPENLTQQIKLLRRALGDEASRPRYIEALRGEGYRLVPSVSAGTDMSSLAVLPFENLSASRDDAYFADGIHEELLHQLARVDRLRVIARTSVMQFAGTRRGIADIANALGVATVMEGSVRFQHNRVRVSAQLIDAATEGHLWSEIYERDLLDVFAIQADIATQIANALSLKLAPSLQRVVTPATRSPAAYGHYLQAIATMRHGSGLEEAVVSPTARTAIQTHLDAAIGLDAGFALPYVLRARLNVSLLRFDTGVSDALTHREALEAQARNDLDAALSIEPDLGLAHATRAYIHQCHGRFAEANQAFELAVSLRPQDPEVLSDAGFFKALYGASRDAVALGQRAIDLDPFAARAHHWLALIYLQTRQVDGAIAAYRLALGVAPTRVVLHANLSLLERARGNLDVAKAEAKIAGQLLTDDQNPAHLALAIHAYGRSNCAEDASHLFGRLRTQATRRRVAATVWVYACLGIGDLPGALNWLRVAVTERDPYAGNFSTYSAISNWQCDPVLDRHEFKLARRRLAESRRMTLRDEEVLAPNAP